jgi:diguanylate cyclase (GGDEF)-like protein
MSLGGGEDARLRLIREVTDTRQRVLLGGVFYIAGWAVVGGFASVYSRHPLTAGLVAAVFLVLAALRFVLRVPSTADTAEAQQAWIDRQWAVVLTTSTLWSGVLCWTLLDPAFEPARQAALLCSIAYATAYAHNFSMRLGRALLGIALIYLPAPVLLAFDPGARAITLTMAIYGIYVVSILFRSHREYEHRLDLDEALRHQRDQYELLSRTDPLTGLANRRHFGGVLERRSAEAQQDRRPLTLLVLDIDHFKRINDEQGHEAGDACLARFAERMRELFVSPEAHLARLGGEEFAVLLPGVSTGEAAGIAEAFRRSLAERPLQLREGPIGVSVSIGVAGLDALSASDGAELYRAADRAMYRAKSEGRDRVRVDGA